MWSLSEKKHPTSAISPAKRLTTPRRTEARGELVARLAAGVIPLKNH